MTHDEQTSALRTALAYHRAWTGGEIDEAMAHVSEGIVCRAPGADIVGKAAYRGFLGDFRQVMTGLTDIAAFGDEEQALLIYCPHTAATSTAPAAEHLTVRDGQIVESRLVFDRLSFAPPQDQ